MRKRLVGQLLLWHLAVLAAALLVLVWFASKALQETLSGELEGNLESAARSVAGLISDQPADGFTDKTAADALKRTAAQTAAAEGVRMTLVAADGVVVFDSVEDAARMENHGARPEIARALQGEESRATRHSATLSERMLYVATPVRREGKVVGVVRSAIAADEIDARLSRQRRDVALVGLLIFAAAIPVLWLVSRRVVRPVIEIGRAARRLADGDAAAELPSSEVAELSALADAIRSLARQVEERSHLMGRKGYEQEAVLASMVEGVLAVDPQERVISLNRAAAELIGSPQAEVLGRNLHEVLRNADLRRFASQALGSDESIEDDVVLHGDADKTLRIRGTALRDAAGRGVGAVIVLHDVTRANHLENIRKDFVANVSHELKTPIASIKGFVETLLDGAMAQPEDATRFLQIIAKQADRLGSIIEDLLSLAKIEQSERAADLRVQETALREVVESALVDCHANAAARQIQIEIECDPAIRAALNPPLMEQAVSNLLDNAVKYSEPGDQVRVVVQKSANEVTIAVVDQGCGVEREHLPRLFERFYRVDKARSRKLGGTGLGLAIVKHIVQAHRGRITVESTVGQGSTFTIHLPAGGGNGQEKG